MRNLLLLIACLFTYNALHAQTVTHHTQGHINVVETPNFSHDPTQCFSRSNTIFTITVDTSFVGDTIRIIDTLTGLPAGGPSYYVNTSGSSPWTLTAPVYFWALEDYYLFGTTFLVSPFHVANVMRLTDTVKYIMVSDTTIVTSPCTYNNVSGRMYADNNSNCVFDAGDVGIYPEVSLLETLTGSLGTRSFVQRTTTGSGNYDMVVQQSWLASYNVFVPSYYSFIYPASSCFSTSYTYTTLPQTGVDFPVNCTHSIDLQCGAIVPVSVRPDRPFNIQPFANNTGCDSTTGRLRFVKDHRVLYFPGSSIHPADTVHGDTLIWNYVDLTSLSAGAYWNSLIGNVNLKADTTVHSGDTLCFRIYTDIPSIDINPLNNDIAFCIPVVYSYDPNVKTVSPKGIGPLGYIPPGPDTLTYTINFQNTGTSYAATVVVIDTLDSHINPASLRIIGTSHRMTPEWLAPNVVRFNYTAIYLPDSTTNEAASHGGVQFKVALNTGLPLGTQIRNKASIYFDFNPPVVTNSTLNTIAVTTTIGNVNEHAAVKVYPNPATDHVTIENLDGGAISVMNMSGSVVMQQQITSNKTTIDLSNLPSAVYLLKAVNDASATTIKITKQ